jgi:hypothetical protein
VDWLIVLAALLFRCESEMMRSTLLFVGAAFAGCVIAGVMVFGVFRNPEGKSLMVGGFIGMAAVAFMLSNTER